MDNRKYEQLINLVINENEEQARELFHEIVVEKSREIFESIMAEELDADMMADDDDMMEDDGMGGQVGDLLDEINAEESGVMEEEDEELDFTDDEDDIEIGGDDEDFGDEGDDNEDAIIRIEDKLDQLMAEFEDIMGGGADDMGGDDDMDFGADEGDDDDMMEDDDMDEAMMEAVQLQKVSVTHGDNGVQTRSPGLQDSGQAGMDSRPVKFAGAHETVPTAPKAPSNFYSKGETSVKGAGNFKNSPGKNNFSDKGEAAPKPSHGDNGVNVKSPVAESRRPARRPSR